ncbi:hypothetical protein [Actinoplanes sp. NBRC 103695]|uniref:hypothetical protein n=1 Tax=Actinoplanes sp. NBRC 103695 TaxID=3032202 RepID=UPI00249FB000|nr:hypothetical protein [Actinoplanes sp. NBRC 103695]GLY99026.1 hypothetical protein Acsp02_62800 [Actinoplanes sp. NBRC 103695]
MFGTRRANPARADPLLAAIATEVVTAAYPDELDLLPDALAKPGASTRRLRAPVGFGVDLAAATPVLVSALSFVAAAAATSLVEGAMSRLSTAAYAKVVKVFGRAEATDAAGPAPETVWQELTALWAALLVERGMRPEVAETTAAQIVAAMRRRDQP